MEIEKCESVKPSDLIASFEEEAESYYYELDRGKYFRICYDLRAEDIKSGLKRFQKETRKGRRYIYIALCLVVVLVNVYDINITQSASAYNYFFIGAAFVFIYMIIFTPIWHMNNIAKAVAKGNKKYSIRFYEDLIYVKQKDGVSRIPYTNLDNKIIEDDRKFLIICSDENLYVIPKRCFSEDKIEKIRGYAKKFEDRYICETKKAK